MLVALVFLIPALILLGALVLYPIIFSIYRSLYGASGSSFVGLDNYKTMLSSHSTIVAIRNNAIWLLAPVLVTTIGLVLAVLAERIKWSTALKVVLFMPMAISSLSAGVIWRLMYDVNPDKGVVNAGIRAAVSVFHPPGKYPGARPTDPQLLTAKGKALVTTKSFSPGGTAELGLVAIPPELMPADAQTAAAPKPRPGAITGVVWNDFTFGGGGTHGQVDTTEKGLPGVTVQAVRGGNVAGSATTDTNGDFVISDVPGGSYQISLADSNFREPWGGIEWLGTTLVTPSIMAAYIWIWAGFAVVVIGAGLAAIPRDVLEAARVDGANEWNVFRRVTVPLLMPVLLVVLVTLVINVMKLFDLIFVTAPGPSQSSGNVIALEMWRVSFGGVNDQGLGSALAVFLFILVLPAMLFNFRRFRAEGQ
jgi:alpha-glucoside transport system permease protein